MKAIIALAALALLATPAFAGFAVNSNQSNSIHGFAYDPQVMVIAAGDTVTWTNNDAVFHTASSVAGTDSFDSGNILPGHSFSHTFGAAGVTVYTCKIHATMVGVIVATP